MILKETKPIKIYWAYSCTPTQTSFLDALELQPKSVLSSFIHGENTNGNKPKPASYLMCPGLRGLSKNIFYVALPFNTKIHYSVDKIINSSHERWWTFEEDVLQGRLRVNLDISYLFFCEESLELEVLPPFLHNSHSSTFGLMASGVMNISKWFRPINATWILNKGVREIEIKKNEPFMYLKFNTTRKIIFVQFKTNEEILSYAMVGTRLIDTLQAPDKTMKKRYDLFEKINMKKRILQSIKKNLI